MRLLWLQHGDFLENWDFTKIELTNINLFVGESGSGKTKLLNVIFNIGRKVCTDFGNHQGYWHILFEHKKVKYFWEYEAKHDSSNKVVITKEIIKRTEPDGSEKKLVDRDADKFDFLGQILPKLSKISTSIFILKEDPTIAPIYEAFGQIMRRNFFSDELERAAAYQNINRDLVSALEKQKDVMVLFGQELTISIRMYFLKEYFPDKFKIIVDYFKSIFTFIDGCEVRDLSEIQKKTSIPGRVPVFAINERKVKKPIPIQQMSSGMQKVILIILDVLTLPEESLYLIDEYENSLGINAINFLPSFLSEHGANNQFIITSHHPYLINAIPIRNWFVFHRSGPNVKIKHGKDIEASYGKSKQQAFIKLINDPFYTEGIE